MNRIRSRIAITLLAAVCLTLTTLATSILATELPWQRAGWTDREAAAHLLDRLSFGPRPGEIDRLLEIGLDTWVDQQLRGPAANLALEQKLDQLVSLGLSQKEIAATYLSRQQILRRAQEAGVVPQDFGRPRDRGERSRGERLKLFADVTTFAHEQGYRSQRELYSELIAQKIWRATESGGLSEVLADFWFNHFNVSLTENDVRNFVTTYERDAIRQHVLGSFRDMLEATAKHPAMLLYLDNARSVADGETRTTLDARRQRIGRRLRQAKQRQRDDQRLNGLNENYARELLELHTLGVDGGYTQQDIVEVARAFTGWALVPPNRNRDQIEKRSSRARRLGLGFVFEEEFIFRADAHDAESKTVLGHTLPAGRGIEDGLDVLDLLAAHPATAHHLATKLAIRFITDEPPSSLVDRLAQSFMQSKGNLRTVMHTLIKSPEFWSRNTRHQKIKSPFELVISALRAVDAEVTDPTAIADWIARIGQPLYAYQAPTGYPDRASAWVNTGALLRRMNFGLQFASGQVKGVSFDLAALNDHHQPESLDDALRTYLRLLLPERDPEPTVKRLGDVIREPSLASKVARSAPATSLESVFEEDTFEEDTFEKESVPRSRSGAIDTATDIENQLAQVAGVILGSPEFQRR